MTVCVIWTQTPVPCYYKHVMFTTAAGRSLTVTHAWWSFNAAGTNDLYGPTVMDKVSFKVLATFHFPNYILMLS